MSDGKGEYGKRSLKTKEGRQEKEGKKGKISIVNFALKLELHDKTPDGRLIILRH